ncbi:MAG: carboxypeptidase-like regulatory domain-containing protein [Steroidobacteraceae bacterium]|jgi:hypothetical protein|nr:carboxypeptidase-like regulatory domain-containing protein [Steroidobacteraceae bacterium]
MRKQFKAGVVFTMAALLLAPTPASSQSRKPRPFTVSGIVLDTAGKPLQGAQVWLRADFVYGRATATTGPDGRFVIGDLIKATYRAEAFFETKYAGSTVCHRLAMPKPTDYNSFPVSEGAERDFRWQLTGKIGFTDTYFGASIRIWQMDAALLDAARAVEFTLAPTGPLLDGSQGSVIVREALLEYPASDDGLDDLPLGTYRLTAVLIGKDGRRAPLRVKALESQDFRPELALVWRSEGSCGMGSDNGVKPFFVELAR